MHICFVCREYVPSLRGGGIASYIKEMAENIVQKHHKVTVICASDDTRKGYTYTENGVNIIRLSGGDFVISQIEKKNIVNRFRLFYRFFSYRKKILETILSIKDIDIIEVPEYGAESYYLKNLPIPVVIRLHASTLVLNEFISGKKGITKSNWHIYWQGLQEFKEIKRAQYITSCSQAIKEIIEQKLLLPCDKIKVINNPIKINNWTTNITKKAINKEIIRILLPGAVYNLKGGEDLIKACIQLNQITNQKFELYLIGKKGNFANYLEKKYASHYNWINIPGPIPRKKMIEQYNKADIICLPSWWENMPMACIEAMLCGSIVIGSNSGGIKEIIEDGKDGFLIPPRNPQILANKIQYILQLTPEQLYTISINAHSKIINKFSTDYIVSQMLIYYNQVIQDLKKNNI